MGGCPDHQLDLAVARNIPLGETRAQIRGDLFLARHGDLQRAAEPTALNSPTEDIRNPQFLANGNVDPRD